MKSHRLVVCFLILSLVLVLMLLRSTLEAVDDLEPLRTLAVQEGGRLRPFDTLARQTARRVTGTRGLGSHEVAGLDPVEWLLSMMSDPDHWRREPMISVPHGNLRSAAGLHPLRDRYSYDELATHAGLQRMWKQVQDKLVRDRNARLEAAEQEASSLEQTLRVLAGVFTLSEVRVVPDPADARSTWTSLRDLDEDAGHPNLTLRSLRDELFRYAREGDGDGIAVTAAALSRRLAALAPADGHPPARLLILEVHYNTLRPFRIAVVLYLVCFFMLLGSVCSSGTAVGRCGVGVSVAALAVHGYGMVLRTIIAGRPPVTNMYESVIWVAWGAMLIALIFEFIYRTRNFAAAAGAVATVSLILAESVPILDDSVEPLVPVLRHNVWLTVHVLTITSAYAAFALAMAIANLTLGVYLIAPTRRLLLSRLSLDVYRCLRLGVLIGIAGTVLGGWWASYSWGRFWGWDAKETSVFVALMFYLSVCHARKTGLIREFGTAAAGALGFLGVLWAWYGVNFVLGVGLHSYGFGSGGYGYATSFVILQLLMVGGAGVRYTVAQRRRSRAAGLEEPALIS